MKYTLVASLLLLGSINATAGKLTEQQMAEDRALNQEISELRLMYPNICFDCQDSEGHTLEMRILDYAIENKIPRFYIAFAQLILR